MSKPLILTIHPLIKDRKGEDWYVWEGTGMRPYIADMYRDIKRLTDAELAAEVWKQEVSVTTVEAMGGKPIRNLAALAILCRFATLPHASDTDYR